MTVADTALCVGSGGVTLLLVAFALNLLDRLSEHSKIYLTLNIIGSLAAAWYAYVGEIVPFLILELVWATVAFVRLAAIIKRRGFQ